MRVHGGVNSAFPLPSAVDGHGCEPVRAHDAAPPSPSLCLRVYAEAQARGADRQPAGCARRRVSCRGRQLLRWTGRPSSAIHENGGERRVCSSSIRVAAGRSSVPPQIDSGLAQVAPCCGCAPTAAAPLYRCLTAWWVWRVLSQALKSPPLRALMAWVTGFIKPPIKWWGAVMKVRRPAPRTVDVAAAARGCMAVHGCQLRGSRRSPRRLSQSAWFGGRHTSACGRTHRCAFLAVAGVRRGAGAGLLHRHCRTRHRVRIQC